MSPSRWSGLVGAAVATVGLKLDTSLPDSIWFALGVFATGLVLLPLNLVNMRMVGNRVSRARIVAYMVVGVVVGGLAHSFLRQAW